MIARTIDKIVGIFSPAIKLERTIARKKEELINKASAISDTYFHGASKRRTSLINDETEVASADHIAESGERETLIARSQSEYMNNSIPKSIVDRQQLNVVGAQGIKPNSKINWKLLRIEKEEAEDLQLMSEEYWKVFCKECDITRTNTMVGLQTALFTRYLVDGDVILSTPYAKYQGNVFGLKLQLIEASRMCNPNNSPDTKYTRGGVDYEKHGAPKSYNIMTHFPGEVLPGEDSVYEWIKLNTFGKKTGLRRVFHIYKKLREGQSRGIPCLAHVIEPVSQLRKYRNAEIMASVVSAMFTLFVKSEDPNYRIPGLKLAGDQNSGETEQQHLHLGSGLINYLRPNENVDAFNPSRPNTAYEPFTRALYQEIGAGANVPFEEMMLHFQSSYSAARAAIIQAWKLYMSERTLLSDMALHGVWELLWEEMVQTKKLKVKGWDDPFRRYLYTNAEWFGKGRTPIDILKSAKASVLLVNEYLSSRGREALELSGGDISQIFEEIEKEQKDMMIKKIGIYREDGENEDEEE